jgi:uncharacterized protein YciI
MRILLAIAFLLGAPAPAPSPAPNMEKFELVFLRRPADPKPYPEAELNRIQEAHLAHLGAMAKAGKMVVAGPLADQQDQSLRGICLYRTGSLEETRQHAESDPAVKAGRLKVEVMSWWTQKGALAFPVADQMQRK